MVLFSGGLDSRLVVKIMQEKGFEVIAVFFKLPFAKDNEKEIKDFLKEELGTQGRTPNNIQKNMVTKGKLKVFDCTKGNLLKEYLKIIKKPKYGRGVGINPCVDCKIFMFSKTKEFASKNKIEFIATGEVIGQRPMSQTRKATQIIEKEAGLKNRIRRPLVEFYGIQGRKRDKQIALAKKFNISYPTPAGGCALCEKKLKKRFEFLLDRGINDKEIKFVNVGRHFVIDKCWVVLGKDEKENKILENFGEKILVPDFIGPSALIFDKCKKDVITPKSVPREISSEVSTEGKKINKLIEAYSKKGSLKERRKFEKFKL